MLFLIILKGKAVFDQKFTLPFSAKTKINIIPICKKNKIIVAI